MPRLYLRYQKNLAVPILLQTLPAVLHGEDPVVGDLIAAFASDPIVKGLLGISQQDYGPFTIGSEASGRETSFNPWDPLTVLGDVGTVGTKPLFIRSINDTITMDEYMVWPLPDAMYDSPVCRPNSSGSTGKTPTHVFLWAGFKQAVNNWIVAHHDQHSQRVHRPVFIPRVITEEVQTLQPFVLDNLLEVSAKCFIPASEFKARRQIAGCIGEPDHLMTRNGQIVAIVEEKGRWTLSSSDIVNSYSSASSCASAVNQLYRYMRLNHRKYGILSSYEHTWFVYRSQECTICDEPHGHETLYISEGISYMAQTPTALQCFSYFNSIANDLHMESPPTSKRPSRPATVNQISRPSSSSVSSGANHFRGDKYISTEGQIHQNFDVDDFKFNTVLGEGRSRVYLDLYESQPIALKTADIAKHTELLRELLNEVSVYKQLSALQGNGIPKFVCHGFVEEILYCVGVSICGTVAKGFTEEQKKKLLETLGLIHALGIVHNDIKKENILIDQYGNPFLIDFGLSERSNSPVAQIEERNALLALLESY